MKHFALTLAALCLAAPAFADRNITVDANNADWSGATTCFSETSGDASGGIDLVRACLENNNATSNAGYLFAIYEAASNLPTNKNQDTYFGFIIDRDNNGVITVNDEAWAIHYGDGSAAPDALMVFDPINFNLKRSYNTTSNCGGTGAANGWSGVRSGKIVELRIAYGCLGLSFNDDERLFQLGVYPNFDTTAQAFYNGTSGTLTAPVVPSDVVGLVAISGQNRNRLVWTNPSQHQGVLILRSTGSAPSTAPTKGTQYAVGSTVGNATAVYADTGGSAVSTFTDTGLTNGTRYYYRVYNHHQRFTYASGNVPSSSGVFSEPTSRTSPSPLWCYSMGLPSMQMPVTEAGGGVVTENNQGQVTANRFSTDPAVDGDERWRPVQLAAAVQARAPLGPLVNRTGNYILTGDQSGKTYVISSSTGTIAWTGNGGAAIGDSIQAPAGAQLFNSGNAAFKAANGPPTVAAARDLVFFATRNSSATNNRVVALSSVNGALVWSYQPGNLDIINGGVMVDYVNNRVFVGSRSNGNTQSSLRVLNSLTGALVAQFSLGDIDTGVIKDGTTAYVVNTAGTAYGINMTTLTQAWSVNIGATSTYLWPMGGAFVASVKSGSVQRWNVSSGTPTLVWSRAVPSPSGLRLHNGLQKFFVGSSDGKIHQLNASTGVDEKQLTVSALAIGAPHIDETLNRLAVGSLDGRLCSFQLPLP